MNTNTNTNTNANTNTNTNINTNTNTKANYRHLRIALLGCQSIGLRTGYSGWKIQIQIKNTNTNTNKTTINLHGHKYQYVITDSVIRSLNCTSSPPFSFTFDQLNILTTDNMLLTCSHVVHMFTCSYFVHMLLTPMHNALSP